MPRSCLHSGRQQYRIPDGGEHEPWHHTIDRARAGARRRDSRLAVQYRLGLLPGGWYRSARPDRVDPPDYGQDITLAASSIAITANEAASQRALCGALKLV